MDIKEFGVTLHMPQKLEQKITNGKEIPQMLPPRREMEAHPVDSYPACPDSWMNGSDIASSYFVGVEEDKGMWLDFNDCACLDRDVAVVISVQGISPITGQKTDILRLEQYKKKCPIHDVNFKQDSYCPKCDFDWPDQNYLATTGTPNGNFWLDGFRRPDGTVRQYIFTAEEMKGIASQLIGKDKVYAIGIAFYYSKEKKPQKERLSNIRRGFYESNDYPSLLVSKSSTMCTSNIVYKATETNIDDEPHAAAGNVLTNINIDEDINISCNIEEGPTLSAETIFYKTQSMSSQKNKSNSSWRGPSAGGVLLRGSSKKTYKSSKPIKSASKSKSKVKTVKPVKKLEIGAGALINQKVYRDSKDIDYWEEKPAGMLYINYCDMETFNNILKAGEIEKKSEGFMDNLTVGS